jgi:uncharacterized protein (DUF924 family)
MSLRTILDYWFGSIAETPAYFRARNHLWFRSDPEVDATVRAHFIVDWQEGANGKLDSWALSPRGRLALIVLLDQFSRNIFRGTPQAFAQDPAARRLCLEGLEGQVDKQLHPIERIFFYLPLEHAEDLELQQKSISVFSELAENAPPTLKDAFTENLDYALRHHEIIATFGRFPHRNAILKRVSTPEEEAFLKLPGSSF